MTDDKQTALESLELEIRGLLTKKLNRFRWSDEDEANLVSLQSKEYELRREVLIRLHGKRD